VGLTNILSLSAYIQILRCRLNCDPGLRNFPSPPLAYWAQPFTCNSPCARFSRLISPRASTHRKSKGPFKWNQQMPNIATSSPATLRYPAQPWTKRFQTIRLNRYEARYWLDLAGAYQFAERTKEQGDSVEHAVEADPTTPHVAWEAANFFLVQGNRRKALRYFRVVLANDPEAVDSTLQLCWRATGDATEMLDNALPPRPDLYLSFLGLLVAKQEVAAAENVWNRLIGLQRTFSAKLALPYFRFLIAKQEANPRQPRGNIWPTLTDLFSRTSPRAKTWS
jgi:tetratricopeptide (TPR) repeat protein